MAHFDREAIPERRMHAKGRFSNIIYFSDLRKTAKRSEEC
jgi:catalase